MALDPVIAALMNARVWVAKPLGRNSAGDPKYQMPLTSIMARVEPHVQFVRSGPDGEEVNSSHAVYTATQLGSNDLLWVPGADPQDIKQGRIVKSNAPMYDEEGAVSHYEVLV